MEHILDMADADPAMMRFRMEKEQERKALRDKFAMAALATLCNSRHEIYGPEHVAKVSYEYADAMLKAREAK